LLDQISTHSAAVLVLDDLHWADHPTLALLAHVLAEAQETRLLLLGTYRDSDLSRDHPLKLLLADLHQHGVERLALRGLSHDEVVSIMEALAGHDMDSVGMKLAQGISAETDGNPFFVAEILRHLSESGALVHSATGRWELRQQLDDLGLPQSVREVIGRRVDRLGDTCRSILSSAAVIGRDFDVDLLLRTTQADEDEVIDVLDAATNAALLQESSERPGVFSFAHNLINHTLYEELGVTRRARLHRRVAEALEELCAGDPGSRVTELARHWTAATAPVDMDKALAYSWQAGEHALTKLAPDEATRWFTQALELLERSPEPDPAVRCDLMIALGEAQRQAAQPEFRTTLLSASDQADALGDTDRMARAALANSRGFASVFGTIDQERVDALERAIEGDRRNDSARSARLISLLSMELQFEPDHERRRALADQALQLARMAGDARSLSYVLRDHFHATWSVDTLEARCRTAAEMMDLADHIDDPLARVWALDRAVHAAVESGRLTDARETCLQLRGLGEELGQPILRWPAVYYTAGLAQMSGDLMEADRLAQEAANLGVQAGEPDAFLIFQAQIGGVRVSQGRTAEIIEPLEQAAADNPGIPGFQAGLAVALCDIGRVDEAASMLERVAENGFASVPHNQAYSTALALWARTAAEAGSKRAAALLYDLIEPWRDVLVWNGASGFGAAESYLGMLAATLESHARAKEHFAAASRLHEREGVRGWEAISLCYQARSLLSIGETQEAQESARRALALAQETQHESSARRAEEILQLAPTA
jgi:tetratricopeptide (TPR) repeat protein